MMAYFLTILVNISGFFTGDTLFIGSSWDDELGLLWPGCGW